MSDELIPSSDFFADVRGLLADARRAAFTAVNSAMVAAYWQIGRRIVEEEQVEMICAAALEGFLCGHLQIGGILLRAAQGGIGEARVALGTVAEAAVDVVADGAHEAIGGAVDACERLAEHVVRAAHAIDIGGDEGAEARVVGEPDGIAKALLIELFSKVHEASAAPGSVGDLSKVHAVYKNTAARRANGKAQRVLVRSAQFLGGWWQGRESNSRPRAYESPALPLSYPAIYFRAAGRCQ